MENKKTLEQEKRELNVLLNKGVEFTIEDVAFAMESRFFGLIRRRVAKKVRRSFRIEEPTLGTLDRLSAEWIELAIDEERLKNEEGMRLARQLAAGHALRCARIVALAVMGSDYLIPRCGRGGVVRYVEDRKRLAELTALFARTIKPSKLYQLCVMINAMCNLGDFMNSIRLLSAGRTSMPIRIEENKEV